MQLHICISMIHPCIEAAPEWLAHKSYLNEEASIVYGFQFPFSRKRGVIGTNRRQAKQADK